MKRCSAFTIIEMMIIIVIIVIIVATLIPALREARKESRKALQKQEQQEQVEQKKQVGQKKVDGGKSLLPKFQVGQRISSKLDVTHKGIVIASEWDNDKSCFKYHIRWENDQENLHVRYEPELDK